jgi:hypothetical protein
MRFTIRFVTILFILFITCLPLLAQLPDFYDPLYDFEEHILQPKQAESMHILSCTITQNGKFQRKILYDGNGHVISDGQTKHIYRYNENGAMDYIYNYDADYNEISSTDFSFNSHNDRESILEDFKNSESGHKYIFYYNENTPVGISQEIVNMEDLQLTEIKTQYGYSESGELIACKISEDRFKYPGKVYSYAAQSLFNFVNGSLDNAGGWMQDSPDHIVYESFKYSYDDNGQLHKIQNSIDSTEFEDLESYTYYANGLLKTRSTQDAKYDYKYEFMNTARVNIEIQDDVPYPKLYQYWRNYEFKRLTKAPGKWSFDIYLPGLEFFILEISSDLKRPFILEPGKTVNIKYADGKFLDIKNDPSNDMIWEIEEFKRKMSGILTKDGLYKQMGKKVDEYFRANPTLPVFLYYSHIYNLRYIDREEDAFDMLAEALGVTEINYLSFIKEYAKSMIRQYPLNSLAIQKYSFNKE